MFAQKFAWGYLKLAGGAGRGSALYNRRSLPAFSDFNTVAEAWVLLWACRVGLWVAPFPRVLRGAQFCGERLRSSRSMDAAQAVDAVRRALPLTLRASCLTQALAGWILLTRHGVVSRVRIGVSSAEQQEFKAHAWLEVGGEVILGDEVGEESGLDSFHVIWTLPPE